LLVKVKNDFLKYGHISLRPLEPTDVDLLYAWENNPDVWEISDTKAPFSKYALEQYIKDSVLDIYSTKQLRLIIETTGGKPVGAADLFDFEPYHQRAGVGILIHNRQERNKGFASDALLALINYSSEVLGLRQLYANIPAGNEASLKLFTKLGFEQTGTKTSWMKTANGWKDVFFFQKIIGKKNP
jgi:diamine N-acetyltransferase